MLREGPRVLKGLQKLLGDEVSPGERSLKIRHGQTPVDISLGKPPGWGRDGNGLHLGKPPSTWRTRADTPLRAWQGLPL